MGTDGGGGLKLGGAKFPPLQLQAQRSLCCFSILNRAGCFMWRGSCIACAVKVLWVFTDLALRLHVPDSGFADIIPVADAD